MSDHDAMTARYELDADAVEQYRTQGWLVLRELVPREVALELYEEFRAIAASPANPGTHEYSDSTDADTEVRERVVRQHRVHRNLAQQSEKFRRVVLSPRMASIGQQLLGVERLQSFTTQVFEKPPQSDGGEGTGLHQDFPYLPFDRSRGFTIWVALKDLPRESGTLQFVPGSNRMGVFGRDEVYRPSRDFIARLGAAQTWELTEPHDLQAGDATIHADLTLHGAGPNLTAEPRIGLAMAYVDCETLYTGAQCTLLGDVALEPNQPLDPEHFPLVGV